MSHKVTCPNCNTDIDLDKLWEERYKHMLEEQEKKLEKEREKDKEEMSKKALELAEEKAKAKAKETSLEMEDLKARLKEQEKASEEMKRNELEMRKRARELEEKEKNWELEMSRKMDLEKKKLEDHMAKTQAEALDTKIKEIQEENRKKELEMIKQQDQMKKTIDDLKRKAEQGSQQIQWDIQEEDLKNTLSLSFPIDNIEDVPTGIKWADLIQTVRNNIWKDAWIIVWESKNTKAWTDDWIKKLKDDRIKVNGQVAILVTSVLPKGMNNFGFVDDIIVSLPEYSIQVATMLRDKLLSISRVETSLQWKDMKMEMLYKYLTSEEFGSKVNNIVDAFSKLKEDIDIERRAMEKIWKRREKELERVIMSTSMMHWDFEGIIWNALPGSERLELWWWE